MHDLLDFLAFQSVELCIALYGDKVLIHIKTGCLDSPGRRD